MFGEVGTDIFDSWISGKNILIVGYLEKTTPIM